MKKILIACMLAVIVLLLGVGENGYAAQNMTGGFLQPEYGELLLEDLPEEFEEEISYARGAKIYHSQWDQYSTNYYYNQLTIKEKVFWDALDTMCLSYLTGTKDIEEKKTNSGRKYLTDYVVYTGMTNHEALELAFKFKLSNPQYYYLDLGIYSITRDNGGYICFEVFDTFVNGTERMAETQKMRMVIESWMKEIHAQPTEMLKEKKAHDLICEKVIYDAGYFSESMMNVYNQVAYSVFCTDSTVCAGYSQAMQLLMNAAGIDCAVVTSLEHEWNIVRINGTWYYVDLTWNDLGEDKAELYGQVVGYMYFNRSADRFADDTKSNISMHTLEDRWIGYMPILSYDSGATWTDPGTVHIPTVTALQPQITVHNDTVSIAVPLGGNVYYTTDGTNPGIASTKATKYTGAFTVTGNTVINAIAVTNGQYDSTIATAYATPKYTVSFRANGGYIGKKTVEKSDKQISYGTQVGNLPSPKKKGYAFLGWYTEKSGGSAITSATTIKGNTTYYAHWAKIKAKKATIASVKSPSKGTMRIKIKKIHTASGYQIRYSLKKNMSSSKKKTVTDTSIDIQKLKKGKKYYVQVRMFQKESVSGKKNYGKWSKIKTIKIKK